MQKIYKQLKNNYLCYCQQQNDNLIATNSILLYYIIIHFLKLYNMDTLFVFLIICFFGFLFINSNLKDTTEHNF